MDHPSDNLVNGGTWSYHTCLSNSRSAFVLIGRGRITPAPSTVDLHYPDKSKATSLNQIQEVEAVNEEAANVDDKKPIIPRTRYVALAHRSALQIPRGNIHSLPRPGSYSKVFIVMRCAVLLC